MLENKLEVLQLKAIRPFLAPTKTAENEKTEGLWRLLQVVQRVPHKVKPSHSILNFNGVPSPLLDLHQEHPVFSPKKNKALLRV